MKATYINALEMRAKWLRYAKEHAAEEHHSNPSYAHVLYTYAKCLETGDSYYMNRNFCALVDHARLTVPDEVAFEESWMLSPAGFVWLETPFHVPEPHGVEEAPEGMRKEMAISALGWMKVPVGYHFMCFLDYEHYASHSEGFACWSHFTLHADDKMIDRVRGFEQSATIERTNDDGDSGLYAPGRETEVLHEIRWVYSALHLMAQRLTHVSPQKASGMARHSAARKRLTIAPILKVVSLRRMEAERPKGSDEHQHRDWQWQWVVNGHWRLQPYKTLGDYKWIFIESYVKGPDNKPLKPPQHIIYKAQR